MDQHRDACALRNRLFALLKERSFRRGRVVLASGRESDYYFDTKPTMLHPEGAALLAELILKELKGVQADCVGGLEMGAVPLIAPVAMRSLDTGRPLSGFFVRKGPKGHGTRQRIEGLDMAGKTAIILEDVTTTGGSAMQAVEVVKAAGGKVALVLSILDRGEGAAELYAAAGVPFKSLFRADEFLAAAD
ncbi:MAG: orotate phosphoribosyltransferase [Methyloceanibacter sp.]